MVWNIPLDKETKSNYLVTSLSPLSKLLSKCTVNTRHAWTWKSNIKYSAKFYCRMQQQIVFAGIHCLANTQGIDWSFSMLEITYGSEPWQTPVGLILPPATKTGLSLYPTTQCQSAWITYLYQYAMNQPLAHHMLLCLSSLSPSATSFSDDLPTAHLVSQILIFQYS